MEMRAGIQRKTGSVPYFVMRYMRHCLLLGVMGICCFLVTGCYTLTKPRLLIQDLHQATIRDDWKTYGAYYEVDELFLEGSFQEAYVPFVGSYSSPVSHAIVSKRIRILTKEGTQYATVPVPFYLDNIKIFSLSLYDKTSKKKQLNIEELKTEYKNNGVIIFPNVTPGCVLDIYIEFTSTRPITVFEYRFARKIPVRHGRFTFSRIPEFEYAFKEYGKLDVGRSKMSPTNDDYTYTIWSRKNILPQSSVGCLDYFSHPSPRVALTMKYGFNKSVFSTWDDISTSLYRELIEEPYTILEKDIARVLDTLVHKTEPLYNQADQVLKWIQDNISLSDNHDSKFSPDEVVREGKGSIWEIAVALKEMFKYLGIQTDMIMTRPRTMGGFDEDFVTPLSVSVPIVTATIARKEYASFPYARGGILGEYPQEFYDLKGVSLKKHAIVALPPPISEQSTIDYFFTIDLTGDSLAHSLDITFKGYFAYQLRKKMIPLSKKEITEFYQKLLTNLDESNNLNKCKVSHLNDRGKPLTASIQFSNKDQVIIRKGVKRFSLSHVFDTYFTTLDTNRTSPYTILNGFLARESVTIKKPESKKLTATMYCDNIENKLFTVSGTSEDNSQYYIFTREVIVKKCDLLPIEFPQYLENIGRLNQIKDSYVIIQ